VLFNSYHFIFLFLPLALIGYQVAGRIHHKAMVIWLGIASLAFYACWRPKLLYILVFSIALNYVSARLISRRVHARFWLIAAIVLNLTALGYYKYLFPYLNILSSAVGSSRQWTDVVLPLGISFFTFTQIAYLVDLYQGVAEQSDLSNYVLFVTFFPHLIAGPILHHKEMMPQFQEERRYRLNLPDLAVGFSWFIMGLGKKVLIADRFALMANPIFAASHPMAAAAWIGSVSYGLQIYFDFSGYSDMALGLARMFSINFPLNFDSPFKSASIIEFWQRWHITLSRYITSYLYTPMQLWMRARRQKAGMGVSRKDMATVPVFASMVAFPTMFTMFIVGVWHGAGFQFIAFGLLHGMYLTVNHAWRIFRRKRAANPPPLVIRHAMHAASVFITFLCAIVALVFFRANSLSHASSMLVAMAGMDSAASFVSPGGYKFKLLRIAFGFAIVWFLPNTQQILSRYKPSLEKSAWQQPGVPRRMLWCPDIAWGLALGVLFFCVLVEIQNPSTFLYFQF
jgi:alginate O-acetyltransferase complex protein AlgI